MTSRKSDNFFNRITNPRYLINTLLYRYLNEHGSISYAQEGEDRLLFSIFQGKTQGFYIDVGAHHPQRFSNTNLFYNMGWSGINIEANKVFIELFKIHRKRDLNLNLGVGLKSAKMEYFIFDEPAVNTFDKKSMTDKLRNTKFKVIGKKIVKVVPLSKILSKYLSKNQKIDFLTVDVEGKDYEVLKSNNWKKYRPHIVVAEVYGSLSLQTVMLDKLTKYLDKVGYVPIAKTLNSVFYKNTHE